MKSIYLYLVPLIFIFNCNNNCNLVHLERAFYYWKSNEYVDDPYNISKLKELMINKLYIKLFEVDYSETMGNFPYEKSTIFDIKSILKDSLEIIPTIFIKNGIFEFNDENSLNLLAENIHHLINKRVSESLDVDNNKNFKLDFNEIQIDCDWTKSTKDKYFYLLKKIKEISKKKISCTLRLYPFKYQDQMGVPPVDKCMLMCYNLIKPLSQKDKNSILDIDELNKYIDKPISYPKHLDIALPAFNWTQVYKNDKFTMLLDLTDKDFQKYTKPIRPMWFEITEDTEIDYENYLRKGDQIKYEDVEATQIHEAISVIKKNVQMDNDITISLFDLDQTTFKLYSNEEINSFYSAFAK